MKWKKIFRKTTLVTLTEHSKSMNRLPKGLLKERKQSTFLNNLNIACGKHGIVEI